MSPRSFIVCLTVAALAFAIWGYRDSKLVRRLWPSALPTPSMLPSKPTGTSTGTRTGTSANQALGGLRKCRSGTTVSYTDSACPPGSHEEAISGGSLTVVPAQRAAQEPAKPQSVLRTLSGGEPGDLQRKHIEREVGP